MLKLRDYQQDLYDKIKEQFRAGERRVLAVLPCGGGKTALAAKIMQDTLDAHERGECVLLCHRTELKNQHISTLQAYGVDTSRIRVESVFTEARRLDQRERPLLLVLDEAHLARSNSWMKVVNYFSTTPVLGVSATPCRLDGRSLGDVFSAMVQGVTHKELTAMGRLAPFVYYAPCALDLSRVSKKGGEYATDDLEALVCSRTIYGDVLKSYLKFAPGRQTIAYCVSVRHSQEVAALFNSAGIPAASLDGSMPAKARADIMKRFRIGELQVLSSCNILSEGLDIPSISCALLLRPTASLALYIQQSCRPLRADPDNPEKRAVILDMVCNYKHGFPDSPREYSLTQPVKTPNEYNSDGSLSLRVCDFCFKTYEHRGGKCSDCPYCGEQYEPKPGSQEIKMMEQVELQRIDREKAEAERRRKDQVAKDIRKARSYADFVAIADKNGYSLAWAKIRARHRGYSIHG